MHLSIIDNTIIIELNTFDIMMCVILFTIFGFLPILIVVSIFI